MCESASDGSVLLVELCASSWRARLDDEKPISPLALVSVLRSVAAGMAYLHDKGIVHRDLKAANVLLRAAKGELDGEYACVSDMGLARHVDRDGRMSVRGTTWVMAPEMLRGAQWDGQIDVFAFGLLVIESVTRLDAEDIPRTAAFLVDWAELGAHPAAGSAEPARAALYRMLLALAADCCAAEPASRPPFSALAQSLEMLSTAEVARALAPSGASQSARAQGARAPRLARVAEEKPHADGWLAWLRALPCVPCERAGGGSERHAPDGAPTVAQGRARML